MNDQIKQIAESALQSSMTHNGVYRPEGYANSVSKEFADKFAELIIKECVKQIYGADLGDLKGKAYYLDRVAEHIETHFGVEA